MTSAKGGRKSKHTGSSLFWSIPPLSKNGVLQGRPSGLKSFAQHTGTTCNAGGVSHHKEVSWPGRWFFTCKWGIWWVLMNTVCARHLKIWWYLMMYGKSCPQVILWMIALQLNLVLPSRGASTQSQGQSMWLVVPWLSTSQKYVQRFQSFLWKFPLKGESTWQH